MKKANHVVHTGFRRNSEFHRNAYHSGNFRYPAGYNSYYHRKPEFYPNRQFDLPPASFSPISRPNFVVKLRSGRRSLGRAEIESLIAKCKSKPEGFSIFPSDQVAATLNFCQWVDALEAFVYFWEFRLKETQDFTPEMIPHVLVPSDIDELRARVRALFASFVKGLMEGKEVERWREESERVSKEIRRLTHSLGKPLPLGQFHELREKRKGLEAEKKLIERRIKEFQSAMECILCYLEGNNNKLEKAGCSVFRKFKFEEASDWKRMHKLIMRERRRLEDGLPIYAYRSEILAEIHFQQVSPM